MSDVIQFPPSKIVREVPTEQMQAIQEKSKQRHIEGIVDECSAILHASLADYGIDTEPETFLKDFAMCIESITSLVERQFGIPNKLQPFVDKNMLLGERPEQAPQQIALPCDVEANN
jgi:hypothetical protein